MEEQKHKTPEGEKTEHGKSTNIVKGILDGSLLTNTNVVKQVPYIFFLTILALIYISNRFHAEKVVREKDALQKEIKEMHSEAITTASEYMELSRQSEVSKLVREKGLDLEESTTPPVKIVMKD